MSEKNKTGIGMYIGNLILNNFRNYVSQSFEFSKGLNIISGYNAQGKTNAAEAIFFLCTGYSPRVTKEKQVINYDSSSAHIQAKAFSSMGVINVSVDFEKEGGKKICLNGVPVQKTGELLGNINSVMFNPQQLKLVQESPEDRRRFMDIALSQINRKYFYALQKYKKILLQRNGLLKEHDQELVLQTLPVWDEQFSTVASEIVYMRNDFLRELKPLCEQAHSEITGGKECLEIGCDYKFSGSEAQIKEQIKQVLYDNMQKDMELGYTTQGPHRDDIKIKINGSDARIFASQGQQRTAALSLKIGELKVFAKHFGEYPVLILDDAMSELDKVRKKRLIDMLSGIQTIITCTDAEELSDYDAKIFIVENGKVVN